MRSRNGTGPQPPRVNIKSWYSESYFWRDRGVARNAMTGVADLIPGSVQ
jgi:hypothetical protein